MQGLRTGLCGDVGRLESAFRSLETSAAESIWTLRRPAQTMVAARYNIPKQLGRGTLEALRLHHDLFVIIANVKYRECVSIPVVGEDLIEFHFRLSGSLQLSDGEEEVAVSKGCLLIWRQPVGTDVTERLYGDGHNESSVTIYCRPSFLERCFGNEGSAADQQIAAALRQSASPTRSLLAKVYPRLSKLVVDLACMQTFENFELVRAEALVLQIVAEILSGVVARDSAPESGTRVSDRDLACLHAARRYLSAHYTPPPTIEELSRRIGLSPTKLKSGFRLVYGQTVSAFSNNLRMLTAKELLRKSDKPIAHVAAELGYEYQNSFTVAFRRHFNVLPKDYRRDPTAFNTLASQLRSGLE